MHEPLRFALFGTGFWARYQLAAWREVPGNQCVALYNRTRAKAVQLGREFGIPEACCYDDPVRLFDDNTLDFIDIVSDVDTHARFAQMAAERGINAITQKPMAPDLRVARAMLATARAHQTQLLVHENFRWQQSVRAVKQVLDSGCIGRAWRGRVTFNSAFPVFENQPFLAELDRFILTDLGTHLFDVARFLFGEVESIYALNQRVNPKIKGEDATTCLLRMTNGMSVSVEISYASRFEHERFPQVYVSAEGEDATVVSDGDHWIRVTDRSGTHSHRAAPPFFPWCDSRYEVVHASIVPCHANLLSGLNGSGVAETTADDNLKTLEVVEAAYRSATEGRVVLLSEYASVG